MKKVIKIKRVLSKEEYFKKFPKESDADYEDYEEERKVELKKNELIKKANFYFPTIPIFSSFFVFKSFEVIFFHLVRLTGFLLLILKCVNTLSSSFSLLKLIGAS